MSSRRTSYPDTTYSVLAVKGLAFSVRLSLAMRVYVCVAGTKPHRAFELFVPTC
jgi:hypothetical protein